MPGWWRWGLRRSLASGLAAAAVLSLPAARATAQDEADPAVAEHDAEADLRAPATSGWQTEEPVPPPRRAYPADAARIGVELGLGLVGPVAGLVIGMLAGLAQPCRSDCTFDRLAGMLGGMLFGPIAGLALQPFFATLGGEVMGGRGNLGGAVLGFLAGAALGSPVIVAGVHHRDEALRTRDGNEGTVLIAGAVVAGVLAMAGSLVGYEVTHASGGPPEDDEAHAAPAVALLPDLGFDGTNGLRAGVALVVAR